jgi:DnaK suppressor protein
VAKTVKKTSKKATAKKKTSKKKTVKKAAAKKKTKKTAKKSPSKKTAKKTTAKKKTVKKVSKKKAAAKKKSAPPKSTRKTKRRKSKLSAKELDHFKDVLLIKRREIIGDVNHMENESLKKSRLDAAGDLSSMPIHMADLATDNYEQEFTLELMDGERKLLRKIDESQH